MDSSKKRGGKSRGKKNDNDKLIDAKKNGGPKKEGRNP